MYTTKFKCSVVTPMFMSGADKSTPELRPSEFKGMMRFWWRAAKAENNITKLREEEAEIFGGTGESEGRSKVKIALKGQSPPVGKDISDEIKDFSGCKYLLYSTFALKTRGERIIRKYIKSYYEFYITLEALDENSFKHALCSLWLAIYLGGFGTRARRGGGCLSVKEDSGNPIGLNFKATAKSESELSKWISINLSKIKSIIETVGTSKYTNLSESKILILKPRENWIDALNCIGEKFCTFRNDNKSSLWEMAAFGMPIMHSGFRIRMVPYNENNRISERLCSPLIIKVIKSGSLYFPAVIRLNFDVGRVGKERRNRDWQKAEIKDIKQISQESFEKFLNTLENNAEEILYEQL